MPVPPSSGKTLTDQLFFRLGGRVPVTLCIDYINRAMSIIDGASSYVWDLVTAQPTITGGVLDLLGFDPQIDIGSNIEITNLNGIPVTRVREETLLQSQPDQYVGINDEIFNNWYLANSTVPNSPGSIVFSPPLAPLAVNLVYGLLPPLLIYGNTPVVRWTQQWMDDLVVDFAEAEVKRIMNFGGHVELEQRCLAKLQDAKTVFSAQRQDTGTVQEIQVGQSGV